MYKICVILNVRPTHSHSESNDLFKIFEQFKKNVVGILLPKVIQECKYKSVIKLYKQVNSNEELRLAVKEDKNNKNILNIFFDSLDISYTKLQKIPHSDLKTELKKNRRLVIQMSEELRQEAKNQKDLAPNHKSPQLEEFARNKHPDDEDILAQTITFKKLLAVPNSIIFIASKDTKFFSPRGNSKTVTKRIFKKFQIRCDHPSEIIKSLRLLN